MAFLMLPYAARPSSSRRHLSASSVGLSFSFSVACSGEGERLRKQRRAMRAALSVRQQWGRRGTEPGQGELEQNGRGICPHPVLCRAVGYPSHSPQPPRSSQMSPCQADGVAPSQQTPVIKRCWI